MRFNRQRLDDFSGGSWGGTKNLFLDPGPVYYQIVLSTNLNNDQIDRLTLTINGDTTYDVTGEHLRMLQAYKGRHNPNGVFVVPFADFSARTQDGQKLTSLVTEPGDSIVMRVKLAAATAQQVTDGDIPEIVPYAVMGEAVGVRELMPRIYTETIDCGKIGKVTYKNFERGPRIKRAHFMTATIDELEVMHNRMKRYELNAAENIFGLTEDGRVPQANIFHFDPVQTGFNISDTLMTAGSSFEMNPTVSAAGDFEVLFETIERVVTAAA